MPADPQTVYDGTDFALMIVSAATVAFLVWRYRETIVGILVTLAFVVAGTLAIAFLVKLVFPFLPINWLVVVLGVPAFFGLALWCLIAWGRR